jgi:hypothetical protein
MHSVKKAISDFDMRVHIGVDDTLELIHKLETSTA